MAEPSSDAHPEVAQAEAKPSIPHEELMAGIKPGQHPEGFQVKTEGKASILTQGKDAFFNPAQVVNRDLSLAVLRQFTKMRKAEIAEGKLKLKCNKKGAPRCQDSAAQAEKDAQDPSQVAILEGLAASGLRAIRYATELQDVSKVDANDLDLASVQSIERNVAFNGGQASERVHAIQGDARIVMLQRAGTYDAVDLDPYGSPVQFLDSAVQAVSEGGLLLITATDMAVLCGNHGEACWGKYGSYPLHRPYCHEMALRILLACVQSHAARHKRIIVPVLSVSIDFYVRVFVRVYTSPKEVKNAATNLMYVYQSSGCDSFYFQPVGRMDEKGNSVKYSPGRGPPVPERCPETGQQWIVGGPFWSGPIHDTSFVTELLQEIQSNAAAYPAASKVQSVLTTVCEELPDAPLYYNVHELTKMLKVTAPPQDTFRSALVNAGYRVSSTHANPLGVKTDAPPEVVWDVMRAWVKDRGGKAPPPGSVQANILNKEPKITVSFSRASAALSVSRTGGVARFLPNPEANWGPKRRHTRQPEQEGERPKKKGKTDEKDVEDAADAEDAEMANGSVQEATESMQNANGAQPVASAVPGDVPITRLAAEQG